MLVRSGKNARIRSSYGHATARGVLRGRRAPELLAGGRAARRDAAGGEPSDPLARETPRRTAARPLRPPRRADRGGPAPVPERAAAARAGRAASRRARRRGGGG